MPSVVKRIREYNEAAPNNLQQLKWEALFESPFRFFRGTCHLFAADFQKLYTDKPQVKTWMCGDLHFENFGFYKGENRLVYFDINDFDESILGYPEPELVRFLSSIVVAGWEMNASDGVIDKCLKKIVGVYSDTLRKGKALTMETELAHGMLRNHFDHIAGRSREEFLSRYTVKQKGKLLLKHESGHFLPLSEKIKQTIQAGLKELLKDNRKFAHLKYLDAAFRVAGTGSLGLQRYCVLCYNKENEKHYLIDIKEARQSCYKKVLSLKQHAFKNEAERINHAGYFMQFNPPAFQSTTKIDKKWFVVKELQPTADKMAITAFNNDFAALEETALQMAPIIAYSQLRSSGHFGSSGMDALMQFACKLQWQKDIVSLSHELAEKNNRHYHTFVKSAKVKNRILP